jgi:hypothetical protein
MAAFFIVLTKRGRCGKFRDILIFGIFMAETSLYVPVLKSKRGEYLSLRHLAYSSYRSITPLIDISPPVQKRTNSKLTTLASQMHHHARGISECWRSAYMPIFVDTRLMGQDSGQALRSISVMLENHHVVPTHGPDRSKSHADAVVEAVKEHSERGVCYRIPRSSLDAPTLYQHLEDFIGRCPFDARSIDIVLDLETVGHDPSDESLTALVGRINAIPHLSELRSLTVVGGSFPVNLAGAPGGKSRWKRHEWELWKRLLSNERLSRSPRYGDYGIQNPMLSDVAFLGRANLRYTSKGDWIVFRGSNRVDPKTEDRNISAEMKKLCKLAVRCDEVKDAGYSWADEYIRSCAHLEIPANDAPTWKAVGFNHHMTYVVHQLRNDA